MPKKSKDSKLVINKPVADVIVTSSVFYLKLVATMIEDLS